jgi:hypothetical protein
MIGKEAATLASGSYAELRQQLRYLSIGGQWPERIYDTK